MDSEFQGKFHWPTEIACMVQAHSTPYLSSFPNRLIGLRGWRHNHNHSGNQLKLRPVRTTMHGAIGDNFDKEINVFMALLLYRMAFARRLQLGWPYKINTCVPFSAISQPKWSVRFPVDFAVKAKANKRNRRSY